MTNKIWMVLACSLFLAAGACKKKAGSGEAMAKMGEFKDKMCACKDAKCAQGVTDDMTKWSQEMAKDQKEPAKVSEEDSKKMAEVTKQMTDCMTKAMGAPGADTTTPTPTATAPTGTAPAAGGVTIANVADYEAKGNEMMEKFTAIFVADGTNCDKLAADVSKYFDDNKPTWDAVDAYEKAHPDDKKAVEKKQEAKMKEFQDKAGAAMDKCKDNKALADAMKKMPE